MKAVLRVRLTPRSARNVIEGIQDGVVLARVAAAPVKGAANDALCQLLAQALRLPKTSISIQSGAAARVKSVEVNGIETDEALSRLQGNH